MDPSIIEGLIYANLDFKEIYYAKNIADPVKQYLKVDRFTLLKCSAKQSAIRLLVYNRKIEYLEMNFVGRGKDTKGRKRNFPSEE